FYDFLDDYEVVPDEDWPEHRTHLSFAERWFMMSLVTWRFGYKTYELELPNLSYWCEKLHFSRQHGWQMWHFLAKQGLLRVWNSCKRGFSLCFSVDVLLDKVRDWLGLPRPAADAAEEVVELVEVPAIAPIVEPWAAPEPELEPELEPEQIAAAA